ncbi:hypothetical protein LeptoLang_20410 [Leptospira interrogans serovar Icterohaemorrhagiae]|nr:hypothetical protein LeptoLang_20410 [Leptospira interrogans serovar Icterohaemorrhagiae]
MSSILWLLTFLAMKFTSCDTLVSLRKACSKIVQCGNYESLTTLGTTQKFTNCQIPQKILHDHSLEIFNKIQ